MSVKNIEKKFFPSRTIARGYAKANRLSVKDIQVNGGVARPNMRWYVEIEHKTGGKASELLIKAKTFLTDNLSSTKRNETIYICHALFKADDCWTQRHNKSDACKKVEAVLKTLCKVDKGYGNIYNNFVNNVFGEGAANNMTFDEIQAGRHRLVDFLIAEYKARND